ncbi:MAG: HEAT repeat domain-containing protein [Endomicrobiia bacterium]
MNELEINNLLKSFRLSLTNIKIYPPTSPIVENQINELYGLLKEILKEQTFITISELDGKIFINDKEYYSKDPVSISNVNYLVQFFIQTGIKSITLKKELLFEELKNFIIAFTVKKPGISTKEIITQTIEQQNIKNITIDEVEYISVLKSDKTIKNIFRTISQPISNFTDLMNVLNSVFSEISKLQDEETKKKITSAVAKQLSGLNSHLLFDLLVNPLPPKFEELGLKQNIVNYLTKQNMEEIFNEIITWCKKLRSQTENETEYIKQLQNFKEFIKLVINSPISELVPVEIFEEIFKIGLIDALPEAIKQKKEEQKSWIAQLDEFLQIKEPVKLLQEKFLSNLQENIEKLCILSLDDKLENIINLMSENLSNPIVKLRQLAASSFNDISVQIAKNNKTKLAKNLTKKILEFLLKEKEETVLNQYFFSLENSLICLINSKDYESFTEYTKHLLLFAEETQKIEPYKSKLIYSLIDKIYNNTKEKILNHLVEEIDKKTIDNIIWFLTYIGERACETLIETILTTTNQEIIFKLTDLIVSLKNQQEVIEYILKYLSPKTSQHKISKIIALAEKISFDFSETLKQIYPYMGYANKIAIINYIQQKNKEENLSWLSSLLNKEEEQVIEYIIEILTNLEYKKASENILKLINTKNKDLKKRVCIALGIMKEPKAIPKLKKIILSKKKFGGLLKGEDYDIRITAAWALGNFSTLPEVKIFFYKLLKNKKEPGLSNIAKEILDKT